MNRLFPWIGSDKSKQGSRTGKTPERAADAQAEASAAAAAGDIKAATKLFEESIATYHSLGMKHEEAAANHAFAVALAGASEFTFAFEVFSAAIGLYRALTREAELASVLRDAGLAAADYSDNEQASAQLQESLSIYTSLGDKSGVAGTLQALGRAAFNDGNADEAREYYNRSLDLYSELGYNDQAALCLAYLSSIAAEQEDFDTARDHYFASIDRYRSTLSASSLSDTLVELGAAPFADNSQTRVSELLTAAVAIYSHAQSAVSTTSGAPDAEPITDLKLAYKPDSHGSDGSAGLRAEVSACLILAPVAYSQDRSELASALFERSIALAKEMSDANLMCHSLLQAGTIADRCYDLPAARGYYEMLKEAAVSEEQDAYMAPALYASANAAYHAQDIDSAVRDCEACLELYKGARNVSAVARTLMLYGTLICKQGDTETGLKLLNESLTLCRHSGDTSGIAGALQCIGASAREVDPVYARECLQECLESEDANDWRIATALQSLAELDLLQGEIGSAFESSSKALSIRKDLQDSAGIAASLELCGHIAAEWGDIETSVILLSRSEAILTKIGMPRLAEAQQRYESNLEKLRSEMGPEDFEKAWAEGTALTLDEITDEVELMLEDIEPEDEAEDEMDDESDDDLIEYEEE